MSAPPPPPRGQDGTEAPPPPMLSPEHHYYEILGVGYGATDLEIRRAYQRLAKKYHPDKQKSDGPEGAALAADRFKQANRAYKVLINPSKRQAYNQVITLVWDIAEG